MSRSLEGGALSYRPQKVKVRDSENSGGSRATIRISES